jgi:hypothetical protein
MRASHPHPERIRTQSGMAYLGVLTIVLLLTLTGLAFILTVRVSSMATEGRLDAIQAGYLAESAANHAFWRLLNEAPETRHIVSNSDDARQHAIGQIAEPFTDRLELGSREYVGLRFRNVSIPQGATVKMAHVEFVASDSDGAFTQIGIHGEDSDDAPTFATAKDDLSTRPLAGASVTWPALQPWEKDKVYATPDLSPIIQEIVNRPGWVEGNSIVLLFVSNFSGGKRRFYAHESSGWTPAHLSFSYADQVPMTSTDYTMHNLGTGRYGYKVREHTPTTFATVATVGSAGGSVVRQSYVVDFVREDPPPLISVDKASDTEAADESAANWAHAVANGDNRLLMVCGSVHSNATVSGITYDGVPLTHHGTIFSASSLRHVTLWYLVNPPAGDNEIAVTFTGTTHFKLGAVSFFGVDQSTPLNPIAGNSGSGTDASTTLTSATGHLVLDVVVGDRDSDPISPAFGQTQLWHGYGGDEVCGASSVKEGTKEVATYWTLDNACDWAAAAVSIRPAK